MQPPTSSWESLAVLDALGVELERALIAQERRSRRRRWLVACTISAALASLCACVLVALYA